MKKEKDSVKYPKNGVIYDGDYHKNVPYQSYVDRVSLEELRRSLSSEGQLHKEIPVLDVRDYGAEPDRGFLETESIQAAIDAAGEASGVTGAAIVLFRGGSYISGSLTVRGAVTLFIDCDSALIASRNPEKMNPISFISFLDNEGAGLTGGGKIYGSGEYYVNLPLRPPLLTELPYTKVPPILYDRIGYPVDTIRYAYRSRIRYSDDPFLLGDPEIERPAYMLWFSHGKGIRIENIILEDSMDWTLVIDSCEEVDIRNVVIHNNRHVANTDGIDISGSRRVRVQHCFISTADDGICIKAPRVRSGEGALTRELLENVLCSGKAEEERCGSEDIEISDCSICTIMNAFKIGTETYHDIRNVRVRDLRIGLRDIFPGMTTGISIESCDGAEVHDIKVENVQMEGTVCPLFIQLNRRNKYGLPVQGKNGGSIHHIQIHGIYGRDAELPSLISGYEDAEGEERRVEDVEISDFRIQYKDNRELLDILHPVRENVEDYPESNAVGDLPAYGMYVRHANRISLKNFKVEPRSMNTRPELLWEYSDSVSLKEEKSL